MPDHRGRELTQRGHGTLPPVFRLLLGPAGSRCQQRVAGAGAGDHAAVGRQGHALGTAGADVDSDGDRLAAHGRASLARCGRSTLRRSDRRLYDATASRRPAIIPAKPASPLLPSPDPGRNAMVHLALPKGRMEDAVLRLMADAGIRLTFDRRGYRPTISLDGFETKILKPQNIVEMLHLGSRDLGFAGADWVMEKGAELIELVDTALDPVRIVAAAGPDFLDDGRPAMAGFVVATEYERITQAWLDRRGFDGRVV